MAESREPNSVPVERNKRNENLQHPQQPCGDQGEVVSDQDLYDVATKVNLSYEDLTSLYIVLGISDVDVQNAELEKKRIGVDSFQLQAVNVLRVWRKKNQATKKVLLDAIAMCGFLQAKQMLKKKWGITLHDLQAISDKEIMDLVRNFELSSTERKALYIILGIKESDVEAAERRAGEGNFKIQTISLLRLWRSSNGQSATKTVLLGAIEECRRVAAQGDECQNRPPFNLEDMRRQLRPEYQETRSTVPLLTDLSTLNLEDMRRQLAEEYLETRGKLPLLPGMPEEFARMEDLFVDLCIVEEAKKPAGVISRELKTYGDIVCITQEVEKGGRKEKRGVKRVLVRGRPGIGKSIAVSKLAYDWACGNQDSPISKFKLLFAIKINEINYSTDLIGVIQDQLLPNVSRLSLKDCLQSNASSVAILFDGYDEASKHFHQSRGIKDVLCSKWLPEACVIVTTRLNQVGQFSQSYRPYLQVEILGFSGDKRKQLYVQKFGIMPCGESGFLNQLRSKSTHLTKLSSIPIILSMLCLLWTEDQKLSHQLSQLCIERLSRIWLSTLMPENIKILT